VDCEEGNSVVIQLLFGGKEVDGGEGIQLLRPLALLTLVRRKIRPQTSYKSETIILRRIQVIRNLCIVQYLST
jgi:hypothetical protein